MAEQKKETQGQDDIIITTASGERAQSKIDSGLPRIRTYSADMSAAIRSRGETLSSIVSSEKNAMRAKPLVNKTKDEQARLKKILVWVGGALLILAGIGSVAGVIVVMQGNDEQTLEVSSIIFPNKTVQIPLSENTPLVPALARIRSEHELLLGEVLRVDVIENQTVLAGAALADALGLPSALVRETREVMVGVHAFDRNQPFIILSVAAFDRSFNAMLEWEPDMARDLGAFFAPTNAPSSVPPLSFSDAVSENLDVRRSQSSWPIIYAYPERNLLVITTNEYTLREVLTRLGSARL